MQNYIQDQGWTVREIIRGDRFNNGFLDDNTILEELMGSQGTTKQKYLKDFSSQNRSSLLNMKKEIFYCLKDNKQWQVPIVNIVENLLSVADKEQFEGRVYIYNPMHIIYTIYLIANSGEVVQWAPNFYILVKYKDRTTMYFGGLKRSGTILPWDKLEKKHFETDLSDLAISLTWGGYMHNDLDVVNDLGLAYGIYQLNKSGNNEAFMEYLNYDFRPCKRTDPFIEIAQYLQNNPNIVGNVVRIFDEFFPKKGWTFI